MRRSFLISFAVATGLAASASALEDRVLTLPADYKTAFSNYMISDRLGQEAQMISLYANDIAREGARSDGALPDGSILIGEIYNVKKDGEDVYESAIGRRVATDVRVIVMMERRAEWADQYEEGLKVGGWEFEVFSPKGENLGRDTTACRECHEPLTDSEYTWTYDHIASAK